MKHAIGLLANAGLHFGGLTAVVSLKRTFEKKKE